MAIRPCKSDGPDFDTLEQLLKAAVAAQLALGKELVNIAGSGTRYASDALSGLKMPKMGSCCDIPEPCWMPKSLGEIACTLSPGTTGEARLIATNGDYRPHNVTVKSAGVNASIVKLQPSGPVALGPKERTTIVATITAPKNQGHYEGVIWVTICSDFYLRWTLEVAENGRTCCFDVTVDDTPDYEDHWYDHFYCPKQSMGHAASSR